MDPNQLADLDLHCFQKMLYNFEKVMCQQKVFDPKLRQEPGLQIKVRD